MQRIDFWSESLFHCFTVHTEQLSRFQQRREWDWKKYSGWVRGFVDHSCHWLLSTVSLAAWQREGASFVGRQVMINWIPRNLVGAFDTNRSSPMLPASHHRLWPVLLICQPNTVDWVRGHRGKHRPLSRRNGERWSAMVLWRLRD